MKKDYCIPVVLIMVAVALISANAAHADEYTETIDVFKKSKAVQPFFKNAYGYAVLPTVGKGGIVIGGSYGTGQVYKNGKVTGGLFDKRVHRLAVGRSSLQSDDIP
jgi:lipid-binding SYLF domain-containing protein